MKDVAAWPRARPSRRPVSPGLGRKPSRQASPRAALHSTPRGTARGVFRRGRCGVRLPAGPWALLPLEAGVACGKGTLPSDLGCPLTGSLQQQGQTRARPGLLRQPASASGKRVRVWGVGADSGRWKTTLLWWTCEGWALQGNRGRDSEVASVQAGVGPAGAQGWQAAVWKETPPHLFCGLWGAPRDLSPACSNSWGKGSPHRLHCKPLDHGGCFELLWSPALELHPRWVLKPTVPASSACAGLVFRTEWPKGGLQQ